MQPTDGSARPSTNYSDDPVRRQRAESRLCSAPLLPHAPPIATLARSPLLSQGESPARFAREGALTPLAAHHFMTSVKRYPI